MHHLIGRGHDFTEMYNILYEEAVRQMYNIRAISFIWQIVKIIVDYKWSWKVFGLFNSFQSSVIVTYQANKQPQYIGTFAQERQSDLLPLMRH